MKMSSIINEAKAPNNKQNGKVICGFPGVGKSTLFKELKKSNIKVLDSDSSTFDKSEFPDNYIKHIKEKTGEGYTILASSHDVVRDALVKSKIPFVLVYPDKSLKKDYLDRYEDRGSPESFIKLLDDKWDNWIKQCDSFSSDLCMLVQFTDKNDYLTVDTLANRLLKPALDETTSQEEYTDRLRFILPLLPMFEKSGSFNARKGIVGEKITTTIDGEDETEVTVTADKVVIRGPRGEMYVVSTDKFKSRYEYDKELSDKFQSYKSKGLIRAFEYEGQSIYFIASWGEKMLCKDGDMLAVPITDINDFDDVPEMYRIEKSVFNKTYKELRHERKD